MNNDNYSFSEIFGEKINKEEALALIKASPASYEIFSNMPEDFKENILDFLSGNRSVDIQADPFFKKIMDPDLHPERLGSLISSVLGEDIRIDHTLPNEGIRLNEKGSFVIMDVAAVLKNGSFIDVEMQKIGYNFPAQRTSCYLSDMVMRQYNLLRSRSREKFSYHDMKKSYLFIIMAQSTEDFSSTTEYIHHRKVSYSSGITLPDTENITYISLDTFQKTIQNISSIRDAWLTFLSKDDASSIVELVNKYPQFLPLYKEIAEFRKSPEEVIGMYSETLAIMDRNMERLMVDELREEKERLLKSVADLSKSEMSLKQEAKALKQETVSLKQETVSLKQETVSLKQETVSLKQEAKTLKQEAKTLKQETVSLKQETKTLKQETKTLKQETESLEKKVESSEKKAESYKQEAESFRRENAEKDDIIRALEARISELESKNK